MKAVVVSPSICDFYFTPGRASALGAVSVVQQLEKQGVNSFLYNLPLMVPRGKKILLPDSHSHLLPYIIPGERGAVCYFNSFRRFGPSPDESAGIVLSSNPEIIFISLFAWAYSDDALELVRAIRSKLNPKRKICICIGGAGVAVFPEYFNETELFDFIITGDAEQVVEPFIRQFNKNNPDYSKVPHLFGKSGSKEDISKDNPEPVLSFNIDKAGKQWLSMILSRGCPLKCKFCSNHLTQGRTFRSTSIEKLKKKLMSLSISKDAQLHINFEDDNLLIRKNYFEQVLKMIKSHYPQATFSIENGLDYTYMTPDYIDLLINYGFNSFTLSLGSSDINILEEEERPADFKRLETILERLKENNIPAKTFLICGLPGDSKESILNSLIYMHSLPTDISISLFYTVPGLPRFENKDIFKNNSSRLCCGSAAYPWGNSMTTEELVTSFRLARLSNLLKKENHSQIEMDLISLIKKNRNLYTLKGKSNEKIPLNNLNTYLIEGFLSHLN